jgi:mono/diheme cytochrome c family protein
VTTARLAAFLTLAIATTWSRPADADSAAPIRAFVEEHCLLCHEGEEAKGGLDLTRLPLSLYDRKTADRWVSVHDRVKHGEMPPGQRDRPPLGQTAAFLAELGERLVAGDLAREAAEGRATRRRLNRHEYENTLRELFGAPWLQVRDILPEDGEAFRFNKVGDALDVSHVQVAQYLAAAEHAMRDVLASQADGVEPPQATRYWAREMRSFGGFRSSGPGHVRRSFPVLGTSAQPDVRARKAPATVGASDPATREQEGVGFVHGTY